MALVLKLYKELSILDKNSEEKRNLKDSTKSFKDYLHLFRNLHY